jgi:NADH pyrophosphatase NudC (nudix superfamily)
VAESQLLTSNASWDAPKTLKAEETQRIGLQIGQSKLLSDKINQLLPHTSQSPAGQVKVGPLMRARLEADPDDAVVTPSESVNYSTASKPELLWTWLVRPKKPTTALVLTAHLEIPLAGSENVLPTDIPFQIQVESTTKYKIKQIFTNWKTWAAIGTTLLAGGTACFRWWTRRRQGMRSVQCPRCGTRQNIPDDQTTLECWKCKEVSNLKAKRHT